MNFVSLVAGPNAKPILRNFSSVNSRKSEQAISSFHKILFPIPGLRIFFKDGSEFVNLLTLKKVN